MVYLMVPCKGRLVIVVTTTILRMTAQGTRGPGRRRSVRATQEPVAVRGHQDSFTGRYAHANGCLRQPPIGSFDSLGVGRVFRIQVVQVADAQRSSDPITTCSRGQPRGGQVRSLLGRTPKPWSQTTRSDYPRGLAVHHSNEHSPRDLRLTGLVPLGSSSLRGSTSADHHQSW